MSDEKVMQLMEQNRPDMYNKIMYASDLLLDEDSAGLEEEGEEVLEGQEPVEMAEDEGFMGMSEEEGVI